MNGCLPCNGGQISCVPPAITVNIAGGSNPVTYRLDITAFTGGLVTCLDSVPITPFDVGAVIEIQIGGPTNPIVTAQKVMSTAAPVVGGIIRPPDYNAISNPYQWYVVG